MAPQATEVPPPWGDRAGIVFSVRLSLVFEERKELFEQTGKRERRLLRRRVSISA